MSALTHIQPRPALTPAEKRGFQRACEMMALWGEQIIHNGISLGGDGDPIPRGQVMAHAGRTLRTTAEALELTITG